MATAQTTQATGAKTRRTTAPKSASRAKSAAKRTTASGSSASTKRSTQAVKNDTLGSYAERAVLIPVGAALIARERVVETIDSYSTPSKANAQLRKFERRGNTARNRVEREITRRRHDGEELANRVQERILNLV